MVMKGYTIVFIGFNDIGKCDEFSRMFENCIPKYLMDLYKHGISIPFEDDDVNLQKSIEFAKTKNMKVEFYHRLYLTPKELETWPCFSVRLRHPLETEGTKPYDYGTRYERECPDCTYRENRISELLIDRKFLHKTKFGCLPPEYFVSDTIKNLIEENGLTGVTFDGTVKDYKGREIDTKHIMKINNVLPPMHETVWWREGAKHCPHQVMYCDSEYRYDRKTLTEIKDFNLTYEYLNNDHMRELVVSNKVRKLFIKNSTRAVFFPVKIID